MPQTEQKIATIAITQHKTLTQKEWKNYQSQFPNNEKIQSVTFEELIKNTDGGKVDWTNPPISKKDYTNLPFAVAMAHSEYIADFAISECELSIGFVIFDAVCLAIGGVGLRAGASRETAEAVADAARPVLSKLETTIAKMTAEGASKKDLAWGVFVILKTIWSGDCLGAVLSAFLGSLTWYYGLLYGATAMATIVAALATDGAAFIAEVVIELATFSFLVADSVNAVKACNL